MSYGILFLRVVVGAVFFAHGAQKLFGWFGGPGRAGTAGFFGALGFRPPMLMALLAATAETSGVVFALGLLTPFAALAMASVMVVAVGSVHWKNGFFAAGGGYEFNLALWAAAVAVAATGPGRFSFDRLIGWDGSLSGLWWGLGVLGVSVLGGLLVLGGREVQPEPAAADQAATREREEERLRA
jgi:putative oxidoreductase